MAYERTYAGLPVVGGDFVVATDSAGEIIHHSVALERAIGELSVTPALSTAAAEAIAIGQLHSVNEVEGTELVVNALGPAPRLAWESTVDGLGSSGASRLTVDVDALTGAVLRTQEHIMYGSGIAAWSGPNPVPLNTTHVGTRFVMADPSIAHLSCLNAVNGSDSLRSFTSSDDMWGNGDATMPETGCVDALFSAQTEARMLSQWLGRNAMDGAGGAWPILVGLNLPQNAGYTGTQVWIGYNTVGQWIGSIDVVAHEMGHGIDEHTPGGISGNGTQEFIGDAFGTATEWFANEAAPFDIPDFTLAEQVDVQGHGPLRNMFNPAALGSPNCYSSSIPDTEPHMAAGPGDHWFYLLAEGSNPIDGQPESPTCNDSRVVGLGVRGAIRILYNAMLMKTSGSSYLKYRTWTLQSAKNLFPGSCEQFNTVKTAWDAVSVPAQPDEPTCLPVACSVFNDGDTDLSGPSQAIYFAGPETACVPDGTSRGLCRRWFGRCVSTIDGVPVTFKAFNDGDSNATLPSDAVYNRAPNVACIPDGTLAGNCRRWFGMPSTSDGRTAECYLFDDGFTNAIGPTHAIYYRAPGQVCMPDGSATGACRKWFGHCQINS